MLVPLPTVIEEVEGGRRWRSIPSEDVMWDEAPESTTHEGLPWTVKCCRAAMRSAESHVGPPVLLEEAWTGANAVCA